MNGISPATLGIDFSAGTQKSSAGAAGTQGGGDGSFGNLFQAAAKQVSKLDTDAQSSVVGLMSGQGVEVHDAMIATQKSELAFELALQVRNKAVSAYQQMMQMQF